MYLPAAISFCATLAAAVMAYGVHPAWVEQAPPAWGLSVIMLSRRLQWPMIATSLILCLALLGLVISGKRRAWWLIGLAPVLALFGHRFLTDPTNRYAVADEPAFVCAADAPFVRDEDHVVGVVFNERAYAYPYAVLHRSPVVMQSDREHRMLLMWSPRANAATALSVAREVKARELDIVSEPADGLLVYNARSGEFVAAVTGATPKGDKPAGVEGRLAVAKLTWKQWKARQPETRVMLPVDGKYAGPTGPLPPRDPAAPRVALVGGALVGGAKPLAVLEREVTPAPINALAGDVPVLLFRDPAGRVAAFDRRIEPDLSPKFRTNTERKRSRSAAFIDADTNTGWTIEGVAVDAERPMRGRKLAAVPVQENVYWQPVRFWFGDLPLHAPPAAAGTAHARR